MITFSLAFKCNQFGPLRLCELTIDRTSSPLTFFNLNVWLLN